MAIIGVSSHLLRKSEIIPKTFAVIHMDPYGIAVQMPTDVEVFISAKFFDRYSGSSVIRRWKPQLFPKLENMMAQKGREVHMDFQGMGRGSEFVAGNPATM